MLTAIAKPFGWLLMFIYELVTNYGLAIIIFALLIKLILLPFSMKSKKGTMKMSRFQPKLKELEKKYEGNKQKYNEEVQKLYKQEKVSPTSGCIWSLIPFPILIALYQAIRMPITIMMGVSDSVYTAIQGVLTNLGFTTTVSEAYVQIAQTEFISKHFSDFAGLSEKLKQIDYSFLGLNLGDVPQWNFMFNMDSWAWADLWPKLGIFLLPIISAALTFLTSKITQKMNPQQAAMQEGQGGSMKIMMLVMPIISLWIGFVMPSALCIYWIASSVFSLAQEIWLTKHYNKILDREDAINRVERENKEAELAEKRAKTEALREQNATERNPNTSKKKLQQTEKQQLVEKAAEKKEKKPAPSGAVGDRKFARGRAYVDDRYTAPDESAEDAEEELTAPAAEDEEAPVSSVSTSAPAGPDEDMTEDEAEPDDVDDSDEEESDDE